MSLETRPSMSRAQFEEAAAYRDGNHWATADGLLYGPEMMAVEGWSIWGDPGNLALTEAQRVLMIWGDLVGQTANGGVGQFVDNMEHAIATAWRLLPLLGWDELMTRLEPALREQAGDPERPQVLRPEPLDTDPKWPANRRRVVVAYAKRGKPWWYVPSQRKIDGLMRLLGENLWQTLYLKWVKEGRLKPGGERLFDFVDPPYVAAGAFDDWFLSEDTRATSRRVIRDFALARREELVRLT